MSVKPGDKVIAKSKTSAFCPNGERYIKEGDIIKVIDIGYLFDDDKHSEVYLYEMTCPGRMDYRVVYKDMSGQKKSLPGYYYILARYCKPCLVSKFISIEAIRSVLSINFASFIRSKNN